MVVLDVQGLKTYYFTRRGPVRAVEEVSFQLEKGDGLGLAGESGCGKTTVALSLLKILPLGGRIVGGKILLKGNFTIVERKVAEGREIIVNPPPRERIVDRIAVSVTGNREDFSVKFMAGSHSRVYKWVGQLTMLFGGGILFSRGFESESALEKWERNFWVYVDETVESLAET